MPPRRRAVLWMVAAVWAVAFFYQWTRPALANDHFESLAKAQQVLRGELPLRDFFDNGRPLTIALSAAALRASHGALIGEALLSIGAIATGIALVFVLAGRLSGSWLLAAWAAGCTLVTELRLYNYAKILIATVAVWLAWRYLDRRSAGRAAAIGAWGAVAFLFRHDFGLYLVVLAAAVFVPARLASARNALRHAVVAAAVGAALVLPYVLYLHQIGVLGTVATTGGATFADAAQVTLRGFARGEAADGTSALRYNAQTWLYYTFLLAPAVAMALLIGRRDATRSTRHHAAALAVLAATLVLFLIRGNLDSRLPDVAAPAFVLLAWVVARTPRHAAGWVAAAACVVITSLAVSELAGGNPVRRLAYYVKRLPGSVTDQWRALSGSPIALWERDEMTDTRALTRWLRECTDPADRVLVFGYYPEVVFFSQRPFAGGQVFLHSGYFSTPAEQDLTVARLSRQQVPFVIVEQADAPALRGTYARIGAYVRREYGVAAVSAFRGPRLYTIYEHHGLHLPTRADGLPCRTP